MAYNCPLWKGGKCDFPPNSNSTHLCSWPDRRYQNCAVYKMAGVQVRGGGMEDQLRAAGVIPHGATVVGGRRHPSDADIFADHSPSNTWLRFRLWKGKAWRWFQRVALAFLLLVSLVGTYQAWNEGRTREFLLFSGLMCAGIAALVMRRRTKRLRSLRHDAEPV